MDLFQPAFVVCVPARNEAQRLPRLIDALAEQDVDGIIPVVITVNNSDDGSAAVVRDAQARHAGRLLLQCDEQIFAVGDAHAGTARRRAMDQGLRHLACLESGVLLSTDADARPPSGWIAANLRAIAAGADLAGGALRLDDTEHLPETILSQQRLLARYWDEVRAIEDAIDPVPWDPPPRHGDHTGASLAITARAYLRAGGVPPAASGEDRGLVRAALATGARLVHPLDIWVRVSARLDGRAAGGMAEAMRALSAAALSGAGPLVPPLEAWQERAQWRHSLRAEPDGARRIVLEEEQLPPMAATLSLLSHYGLQ